MDNYSFFKEATQFIMCSFGCFPGVWLLYADVSEPPIGSIFKGRMYIQPFKMEPIEGSETSAYNNQTPGKHPKEYIIDSKHGESLKSSYTVHRNLIQKRIKWKHFDVSVH